MPAQKNPTRNSKKDLAYISRMTKTLARLESKYSIPVEKRKAAMFIRKPRTKHISPEEFSAIFHLYVLLNQTQSLFLTHTPL